MIRDLNITLNKVIEVCYMCSAHFAYIVSPKVRSLTQYTKKDMHIITMLLTLNHFRHLLCT